MSNKSSQNVSELMDGELEKDCSKFLLKRMQSDDQLSQTWDNYHLMRSYLQQQNDAPLMHDLGAQVMAKIKQEQVVAESPADNRLHAWFKPLLGSAIAASVAWLAVLNFDGSGDINGTQSINNDMAVVKTAAQLIAPPAAHTARVEQKAVYTKYPSLTPKVQQYLIERNGQQVEVLPSYYNAEYMQQLQQQIRNKENSKTAE